MEEKDNIMPDENQLESSENTIKEDETISWSKKAKNKSYVLHIKFDYNLKDYIFVFCLLMTSSINYNILYFPYIILGLILSYFLENKKIYRVKRKLEIFVMFYSILLLLLKIIVLFLNKNNKYNSFIQDNKNVLINLGVQNLKDENSYFYLISTFISEIVMLIISFFSTIISRDAINNDNYDDKLSEKDFPHLIQKYLIISYFMLLGLAVFNISLLSLAYIFIMNILLFFNFIHSSIKYISYMFKTFIIIFYIFIVLQISLINLLNTYHFSDYLTSQIIKVGDITKYYSIFTQIGINFMLNYDNTSVIYFHILSYLFTVLSLISLSVSNNIINFDRIKSYNIEKDDEIFLNRNDKKEKLLEKDGENNLDKNEQEKNNVTQSKFKKFLVYIFTTYLIKKPEFILNICRIYAIVLIHLIRNFFSIIFFIWILFSFLFERANSNKVISFILIFFILINSVLFHIGNIDGFFENTKTLFIGIDIYHFGISKYEYKNIYYFFINLF